jgi:uncharacterized protein YbbK (DUF523 family)
MKRHREIQCLERDAQRLSVPLKTRIDLADRMQAWCATRFQSLEKEDICGYIFKSRSPSCGAGGGLFARAFIKHFPALPVEEEFGLGNPEQRARFIERIQAIHDSGKYRRR